MAHYKVSDLKELKGMGLEQVVEWFKAHGGPLDDDEYEVLDDDLYVGGYWLDEVPVVEFVDGLAVDCYISDCWD